MILRGFSPVLFLLTVALSTLTGAEKHALLVGVSDYPMLDKSLWLKGPVNDVALAKEVLTGKKFGFKPERIKILAGWPDDKKKRPTRSNIASEFEKLEAEVGRGDSVFILMSGHGSQQPANDDPEDIETDGLDEVFLPADTGKWDPTQMHIRGAIADDDFKVWIDAIRAKGAFVWIVFDSCHSGTMTRGTFGTGRVNRHVEPGVLIPPDALKGAATTRAAGSLVDKGQDLAGAADTHPGKLIAMYAAQSLEPTFEMPMPPPDGPRRGLFTTMIMEVIAGAEQPISYRDLAATIDVLYRSGGVLQPTPVIEGNGFDLPVLGNETAMDRPDAILTGNYHRRDGFEINVGHLVGMKAGTILEVFTPAATKEGKKSLGAVKVTKSMATSSFVKPHSWGDHKAAAPEKLGAACRLETLFFDLGLSALQVAIQTKDADGKWQTVAPDDAKGDVAKAIAAIGKASAGRYQATGDDKLANWFLQLDGAGGGALIPATGFSKTLARKGAGSSFTLSNQDEIYQSLSRIARARQLLQIGNSTASRAALPMSVELVKFPDPGSDKAEVVEFDGGGRGLKAGEEIAFRIQNRSALSIDVTLLLVDDTFGISAVYPEPGTVDDNRIPPGVTFTTPRLEVTAERPAMEQLVVLAVRSTSARNDFTCLEQPALGATRGGAAMSSPLGLLLESNLYGDGSQHRGLRRSAVGDYSASIITWTTRP